MYSLIMTMAFLGQAPAPIPPAPAAEVDASDREEEMRSWLLARMVIDLSFDERKSAEAKRLLSTMNEQQLTALVAAYKERQGKPVAPAPTGADAPKPSTPSQPLTAAQQQELDQAKLNLQKAEAYRDHLKRTYDQRILQGQMMQNLVYQNIVNNQMMMYRTNGPYTYGAFGMGPYPTVGYGGLGYGIMNYGGWGYGAPTYGGMYYGMPGIW